VAAGARLSGSIEQGPGLQNRMVLPSLLLGVATGLLWAPCAGPVLGLILTVAALRGASIETSLLLLAYAAGAATSLALALAVGGRVFAAMKRSLGVGERCSAGSPSSNANWSVSVPVKGGAEPSRPASSSVRDRARRLYQQKEVLKRRADGETLKALAKSYGVSHPTIMRALRKFEAPISVSWTIYEKKQQ
jgi:hypothetical protein